MEVDAMLSAAMTRRCPQCVWRLVNMSREDSNCHLVGNTIAHYMDDIGFVC